MQWLKRNRNVLTPFPVNFKLYLCSSLRFNNASTLSCHKSEWMKLLKAKCVPVLIIVVGVLSCNLRGSFWKSLQTINLHLCLKSNCNSKHLPNANANVKSKPTLTSKSHKTLSNQTESVLKEIKAAAFHLPRQGQALQDISVLVTCERGSNADSPHAIVTSNLCSF